MFTLLHIPYYWGAILALVGGAESAWLEPKVEASRQIQVGDHEADVLAILGEPMRRWSLSKSPWFESKGGAWTYRTHFDIVDIINADGPFPHPIPIKFHLFPWHGDDLVVRWDRAGNVFSVTRPKRATGIP